ncbi:hypothetical protein DKAM_0326 [Desulfurococcus amylolyticus 1221n]|uniref:Uncharacterized protein n=1 Tax=Desulfurococcus amylolyticus (strain DSM 18924 / JCM 16383 / VKM B-2413 / 1221n) TaxID=490899 RepID=B8D3H1_DESA1|nr:hypothetical protein [Desulfurococcus amylolyticus]ACL10652.1 hypothetical protein DKAM_0326 [Desulfurococcus amylolyticus 1221n]
MEPYIPLTIFNNLTLISRRLAGDRCIVVFLNDVATSLYGLVNPLTEIRVLASSSCLDDALYMLLESFNIQEEYSKAREQLVGNRIVAVSTRTMPLLVIEAEKNNLDHEIVESPVKYMDEAFEFYIPQLEYLIVKLLSLRLYPYITYGITLLFSWADVIDMDLLSKALEISGVSKKELSREIDSTLRHVEAFSVIKEENIRGKLETLLRSVN